MKNCFDELRRNKEVRKFRLMNHAVEQDMNPAIAILERVNHTKATNYLDRNRTRACHNVKEALYKVIYSFFRKWTKESGHYKVSLKSQVANRIIKNYYNNLMWAISRWKRQMLLRDKHLSQYENAGLGSKVEASSLVALNNERELRFQEELARTAKR